jgi:hypothetical protein
MSTEEEFRHTNRQLDPGRELARLRHVEEAAREFVERYDADWDGHEMHQALDTLRGLLQPSFRKTEQERVEFNL